MGLVNTLPTLPMYARVGAGIVNNSLGTAVTLLPTYDDTLIGVFLQVFNANVRYRLDGGTPDAVTGFQLAFGQPMVFIALRKPNVLKVIQESAGAAIYYQPVTSNG